MTASVENSEEYKRGYQNGSGEVNEQYDRMAVFIQVMIEGEHLPENLHNEAVLLLIKGRE